MYNKTQPETVQNLFSSIAEEYDRTNAILSLNLHRYWNRALIKAVSKNKPKVLLDLCAGTGEIAFGYIKKYPQITPEKTLLLDFCPKMLAIAEQKIERSLLLKKHSIETIVASAEEIPLTSSSVSAVSVAYGIRNVLHPENCYREVYRVLETQGTFNILELTRPANKLLKFGHSLYLKTLIPLIGALTAKDREAYLYLSRTVQGFSQPDHIASQLNENGFKHIKVQPLIGGIATLITCQKP